MASKKILIAGGCGVGRRVIANEVIDELVFGFASGDPKGYRYQFVYCNPLVNDKWKKSDSQLSIYNNIDIIISMVRSEIDNSLDEYGKCPKILVIWDNADRQLKKGKSIERSLNDLDGCDIIFSTGNKIPKNIIFDDICVAGATDIPQLSYLGNYQIFKTYKHIGYNKYELKNPDTPVVTPRNSIDISNDIIPGEIKNESDNENKTDNKHGANNKNVELKMPSIDENTDEPIMIENSEGSENSLDRVPTRSLLKEQKNIFVTDRKEYIIDNPSGLV
jgi:hypothetical protein